MLFYIPIALLIAFKLTLYKSKHWPDKFEMATFLLLNPALLLIDHGHFQYNGVSPGCAWLPSWRSTRTATTSPFSSR